MAMAAQAHDAVTPVTTPPVTANPGTASPAAASRRRRVDRAAGDRLMSVKGRSQARIAPKHEVRRVVQ